MRRVAKDFGLAMVMGAAAQLGLRAADRLWDWVEAQFGDGDGDGDGIDTETCATCGHARECVLGATERASS